MMNPIKVSIITVCKNSDKVLERAIKSVINQDYDFIEYIVVDGKSTDCTVEIIQKYENYISSWVSESDDGIYDAMNKGLKLATGDVVAFLNSDDYYYNTSVIRKIVRAFESSHASIVYGDIIHSFNRGLSKVESFKNIPLENTQICMAVPHPALFVKKELYTKIGNFDDSYRIASDYDWTYRAYLSGVKFCYLPEIITVFSMMGTSNKNVYQTLAEAKNVAVKYAKKSDDSIGLISRIDNWYRIQFINGKCTEKIRKVLNNPLNHRPCFRKKERIYVFGAGDLFFVTLEYVCWCGAEIVSVLDNDINKDRTYICGLEIKKPKMEELNSKYRILISVITHKEDIIRGLLELGVDKERIISIDEVY